MAAPPQYDAFGRQTNPEITPVPSTTDQQAETEAVKIPLEFQTLIDGVKAKYKSKSGDVKIVSKGREWNVHSFLLDIHSAFFRKSLDGRFKEGKESTIYLHDDDEIVLDALVYYFYHLDYVDFATSGGWDLDIVLVDVKMFIIADKYFIDSLKDVAARNYEEHANAGWNTQAFFDSVKDIYNHFGNDSIKTNPLKTAIMDVVKVHSDDLFVHNGGYSCLLALLDNYHSFCKDVALAVSEGVADFTSYATQYTCPKCENEFSVANTASVFICPNGECAGTGYHPKAWWAKHMVEY